jgi:hypothetical protein
MSTAFEQLSKHYQDTIDRLYKEIYENRDEALYWRFAFSYLIGYSKSKSGTEFNSFDEYQDFILESFGQKPPQHLKRGSK